MAQHVAVCQSVVTIISSSLILFVVFEPVSVVTGPWGHMFPNHLILFGSYNEMPDQPDASA